MGSGAPFGPVIHTRWLVGRAALAVFALAVSSGCAPTVQRLAYGTLASPAMGREMEYAVYEPPDRRPGERLPLVLFLHGGGDGVDCFDQARVGQAFDAALAAGRIPRVLVVVAQGDLGFWENWADGSRMYRDWVMRDLLPHVATQYATLACPKDCHVMGISMGGYGALRFGLLEADHFASVTAISAPIMDTEAMMALANSGLIRFLIPVHRIWGPGDDPEEVGKADLFVQWTRPEDLDGLRLMLAWGDHDRSRVIETNERFHSHLEEHGVPHEADEFEGGHDWKSWTPVLERALEVQVSP
jgi:enterochelin esterase-like enzyme